MTFSIDDLPAPFGPMIERISPCRMSKLTSVSALTPPKRSVMPRTSSSTSSKRRARTAPPDRLPACRPSRYSAACGTGALGREVADHHLGLDHAGAAVLEGHLGLDRDLVGAGVERLDQGPVALVDHAAAHLAGPGQLAVVGIELLVEQQEARDPLGRRQRGVDLLDLALEQVVDLGQRREVGVGGVDKPLAFRPFRDHRVAHAQDRDDRRPAVAEHHALAD